MKMRSIKELEEEFEDLKKRSEKNKKKNYDSMLNENLLGQMLIKSSRLDQAREICKVIESKVKKYNKYWLDAHKKGEHQLEDLYYNTLSNFEKLLSKIKGTDSQFKKKENKR